MKKTTATSKTDKPSQATSSHPHGEHVHDILHHSTRPVLETMFAPKSIALIGATENPGSVGRTLVENLKAQSFGGALYAVNPKRDSVLGVKAYPNIKAIPGKIDLAVVVTPSQSVPGIISDCADLGVKGAVIISAGFKETGEAGVELERQVLEHARRGKMRIIGPNCLGVMFPHVGLNATFAAGMARPGSVGFISQSGALCTAILDWSFSENVGFSAFVSVGSMLDVGWGDLIYHLGDDPRTKSIVIYMESIGDARAFLSAAREVALTKPIIVIKVGRTEAAAKAAASHTGSMTGSDEVLDAAFKRVGVLRVNTIAELFFMAEVLGKQPRPKGPRLAIVTNAGGPGALTTDMLISNGGEIAELSQESMDAYNKMLPPHWSHNNPVDVLGDANAERYAKAVDVVAKDANNDGVLVILTPQAMTESTATAEQLKPYAKLDGKPILASWMGGPDVAAGKDILNKANIPTYDYPDTAARTFCYMWHYSEGLRSIYETPAIREEGQSDRAKVDSLIKGARKAKRTILTESESKQVLQAYGIPIVETHVAETEEQAVKLADKIGYPIVLKLFSETITHKTDVGGVQLNLRGADAVRNAFNAIKQSVTTKVGAEHFLGVTVQPMIARTGYELIIGSSLDPQFGPVLLFGTGGQLVEVFKDRALGLPPLNATLARRMMERTRIYTALKGVRGEKAVDMDALEQLMVRFSHLVIENPWITEVDINPLLASSEQLIALDARVVVHGEEMTEDKLPRPAIRPYPTQYVTQSKMKDGSSVTFRPIRPEDEPLMVKFHLTLSERSVHYRYFAQLKLEERIAHERLTRICFNDYDREIAIVVDHKTKDGEHEILGVGRLSKEHGSRDAEYAIVLSDKYQKQGLGTKLLETLVDIGRREKLARISATILPDNIEMQKVSKKVGFRLYHLEGDEDWQAEINL
jgi:acetyltransferase